VTEPILVVDPGTAWTTAAVVTAGGSELLKEPSSGSYCWPTSVALDGETLWVGTVAERRKRSDPALYAGQLTASLRPDRQVPLGGRSYPARELLAALLRVLKAEAERLARLPVERVLVLTTEDMGPVTPVGQEMIAAAAAAGFTDVELLGQPAAVAMSAADQAPPDGGPGGGPAAGPPGSSAAAGEPLLVCDAGASAVRLALVTGAPGRAGAARAAARVDSCGGDRLDALLTESISRSRSSKWIRPLIGAEGAPGVRARLDLAELARRIRHELTDADHAEDTLTPLTPVVRFSRPDFEKMMRPSLGQLSSACRELAGKAGGTAPRVVLVGGCARTPALQRTLSSALGRPVQPAPAPELAALRGGIVWAEAAASRQVLTVPVPVGLRGLAWQIPGEAARLIDYALAPGASYESGQPLARVRTDDDTIWDLVSDAPGTVQQHCAADGSIVATAEVLTVARRTAVGPAERRRTPLRLAALTGGQHAAFSHDGMQVATVDAAGTVRTWDAETAAELLRHDVQAPLRPGWLAAAGTPDGHWLIAYFDGHAVLIHDLTAGRQVARVAKGDGLRTVQFSADGQRLCTVEGKRTRIWEASGRELMSVKERLLGDGGVTMSRDGGRLCLVSRTGIELWEQQARKPVIVRKLPQFRATACGLAFSADNSKILFAADAQLELITLPAGETLWSASLPGPIHGAEFAPDDSVLATVSHGPGGPSAALRDAATGSEAAPVGPADGACSWCRFSPDGRFLISAEGDNAVLWAVAH
jgi:PQQ-like domain/Hsp70 protein